ncbi:hypothetical protein EYF80_042440 [Liparis tanakae]|uniref:Uncharacterized protein n=1 Tax=Liparis tanakae TaxID=230148 RepID=A0A4Z2G479_9TELE|nr:hypothetical protein EYF80_042440 [Liparis tanakae]
MGSGLSPIIIMSSTSIRRRQSACSLKTLQRVVIEVQREERVHQSAESHPIAPAGREVLDIYVLNTERR